MIGDLKEWIGLASMVVSISTIIWAVVSSPSRKVETELGKRLEGHSTRIGKLETAMGAHDRRIQTVESEMKHLPSKDDVVDLKLSVMEMKGSLGKFEESLSSVMRTVHRIDDYLRQKHE